MGDNERRLFDKHALAVSHRIAAEHFAEVVANSDDAITSSTLDGSILSWNRGAEVMYGYNAEEIIGKSISTLFPLERADEPASILERVRRGESLKHYETVQTTKDGRHIDISLTMSSVKDASGAIYGASAVARDITGKKLMDQQSQQAARIESLGVLAGGIAHDFNNLLTPILGYADMMKQAGRERSPVSECLMHFGSR